MKYSADKDIHHTVKNLVKQGWLFYWGGKHGRLRHPDGHPVLTVSKTPGDINASLQFRRDVRHCISSKL